MRGADERTDFLFSYVSPEHRVPADHPLRPIRQMTDATLGHLSTRFETMYSELGRLSIPPEQLLRALLLQVLYSIRSERQLCERLRYDMLFRFFLELQVDGPTFDPSGFAHNRDRLLQADVARLFFEGVLRQAKSAQLISKEHFTVDGTLMEAWASLKSFKPKTKFTGKSVRTKLTSPRRTRRPSWLEREAAQRCFLIPGISSWRIATGCVSMSVWELLMGTRSASTL